MYARFCSIAILVAAACFAATALAEPTDWTGSGGNSDWFNDGNWSSGAPEAGDDVTIGAGDTVLLTNATPDLASLTMSGGTLTFSNWTTRLSATTILLTAGTISLPPAFTNNGMSNRIWLACADLLISSGATLNANSAGFAGGLKNENGHGPGAGLTAGYGTGGGYGGRGGMANMTQATTRGGLVYGSLIDPLAPGSGGGVGNNQSLRAGAGGGAVKIEATGAVTVNGTISANGGDAPTATLERYGGGGSGGGISISCNTFGGTNGLVQANGGLSGYYGNGWGGAGGGGRIAVVYAPAAQALAEPSSVKFLVKPAVNGVTFSTFPQPGRLGTLYFPDNALLNPASVVHHGQWITPSTTLAFDTLVVTGAWLQLPAEGLQLTVTNELRVTGSGGKLEIGGTDAFSTNRFGGYLNAMEFVVGLVTGPVLRVGGNLVVTNQGLLAVYGGLDNPATSGWASAVAVTGDVVIGASSTLQLFGHPTNGAAPLLTADNLRIAALGALRGDGGGYGGGNPGSKNGYGPGRGTGSGYASGGSHGGRAGESYDAYYGGAVNGTPAAPNPGSGGGSGVGVGLSGGALVRIIAAGDVQIDGTVSSDGDDGQAVTTAWPGYYDGAGAGGGIHITCQTFHGADGSIQARGGDAGRTSYTGAGGGGRIAVEYDTGTQAAVSPRPSVKFDVSPSLTGYTTTVDAAHSEPGTLWFPDWSLLDPEALNHRGQIVVEGASGWAPNRLVITNGWLRFSVSGFDLDVTNDVLVSGTGSRLEIGGDLYPAVYQRWGVHFPYAETSAAPRLACGSLTLTNRGSLSVFCTRTNGTTELWGANVEVDGSLVVASNSWIYPYSQPTNGGAARFVVGNLDIPTANAGIHADGFGYGGNSILTAKIGFGPGRGNGNIFGSGAGHGGPGGSSAPAYYYAGGLEYGDSNAPALPGSSGGAGGTATYANGGRGGSRVHIEAAGRVTLSGTITADGTKARQGASLSQPRGGGGSGGSIWIRCATLAGTAGFLSAEGGPAAEDRDGGGAGGRIAVWRFADASSGISNKVIGGTVPTATPTGSNGSPGTVVFLDTAPAITNLYATNVAASAADCVAALTATGMYPTAVYCYWGTSDGGTNRGAWATNDSLGLCELGTYTNGLSGLSAGTLYYFTFMASNEAGWVSASPSLSFSTVGGIGVNNGDGATNVTATAARLRGIVTSGTPTPDAYVCWGDNDAGATDTSLWDRVEPAGQLLGAFYVDVTDLVANKAYYYRCYVTNESSEGWAAATAPFTTEGPSLSIGDASALEGDSGATNLDFTVTLSVTSVIDISVAFASSNGTAVSGSDYTATNGTLTVPAGAASASIRVEALGDEEDEFPSQTLYVLLSSPADCSITDGLGVGTIEDDDTAPTTKVWTGTGTWTNDVNWTPAGPPRLVDTAIIQSGTVTLSEPTDIAALTVGSGATVLFTNWASRLGVTGDVLIQTNATLTLPAAFANAGMSNRVWLACSNFTLDAGGSVLANAAGYQGGLSNEEGHGPGGGGWSTYSAGGGYGGRGGKPTEQYSVALVRPVYGSVSHPEAPGSGGGAGNNLATRAGAGGGAVKIDASGTVTVNGTISANGGNAPTDTDNRFGGGGSGGGISIGCRVLAGETGLVRANGGARGYPNYGGGGGGGRIAVRYDQAAQAAAAKPTIVFSAAPGLDGIVHASFPQIAELGTLYFPDNSVLIPDWIPHVGQWRVPVSSLAVDSLVVTNGRIQFPGEGFSLTVTNDLLVTGSGAFLDIGGDLFSTNRFGWSFADMKFYVGAGSGPSVLVGGDLLLTNGGALRLYAGLDNPVEPGWGSVLAVTGELAVASNSTLCAWGHPTNGAASLIRAAAVRIDRGGILDASEGGYAGGNPNTGGYGPGGGKPNSYAGGGGHGGRGGESYSGVLGGNACASPESPAPGSGGGGGDACGGSGGGLLRLEVAGSLTVDGTIAANGAPGGQANNSTWAGGGYYCGAGAGGGIHVTCETLRGSGSMRARGSQGSRPYYGGPGAGGRIAVAYDPGQQAAVSPASTVVFDVSPSLTSPPVPVNPALPELGTLWVPDTQLIGPTPLDDSAQLVIDGANAWTVSALTVSGWVRFPTDGFALTVTNDVTVSGASARLDLGGSLTATNWVESLYMPLNTATAVPTLVCGGDLTLTGGGSLWVLAAATPTPETAGALVQVNGDMVLNAGSWVYPQSNPTNGASPVFSVANLSVASGAGFNADARGYGGNPDRADGYGPGFGDGTLSYAAGAGHGGPGGNSHPANGNGVGGSTYGDSNAPVQAGSSGGAGDTTYGGGPGGGAIRVEAGGLVHLLGTMTADGKGLVNRAGQERGGGGAGGSIYVDCYTFSSDSNALLSADGGYGSDTTYSGAGGGGRICVARIRHVGDKPTATVAGGVGYQYGGAGTVVWFQKPVPGSIFMLR